MFLEVFLIHDHSSASGSSNTCHAVIHAETPPPCDPMIFCDPCVTLNMQHAHASSSTHPNPGPYPTPPWPAQRPRPIAQAATHREDHLSLHLYSYWLIPYRLWLCFFSSHYLFKLIYIVVLFPDFSDLSMQDRCVWTKAGSECSSLQSELVRAGEGVC